jgi:UDP-N-acetylmuramoylalanine--D-glutamate ligase
MKKDYRGRRVTVMGLGHFGGGLSAARWLARQGARVTVSDAAGEAALAPVLAGLADVPIAALHLGGHQETDFQDAELVVVNPAVRPGNRFLEIARRAGAELQTEIGLFLRACPAPVIGVTGSNGKSTTAAMTAAILKAAGVRAWLGGNIGGSLLEELDRIHGDDWVVLELSSFQLWHLADDVPMPHVAVVTGCRPNHLDWHESYAHYVAAKQRILAGQTTADAAVLNPFDAEVGSWGRLVRGRQLPLPPLESLPNLLLPGQHNLLNAACAAAAAAVAVAAGEPRGLSPRLPDVATDAIFPVRGLETFAGLPQRLEWFAVVDGRQFYNDSASTTPESTVAALEALERPPWLLAGGADKGCDFGPLVKAIARAARGVALFGAVAEMLRGRIAEEEGRLPCVAVGTMAEALRWCWDRSQSEDRILLSPACSSHDQFGNFRQRGEQFVALVSALAGRTDRQPRALAAGPWPPPRI